MAATNPATDGGLVPGQPRTVSLLTDASLDDIVAWALTAVGGGRLVCMTGLRQDGPAWLKRYEASGGAGSAVVRVGEYEAARTHEFEVRGMALARAEATGPSAPP